MIYQAQQPTKHTNRMPLVVLILLLVGAVIGITIWYLQKQTVTNPHAAASTTLAFTPLTQTANNGQQITSAITVDPGTNTVSVVKLVITYDNTQIQIGSAANSLKQNTTAFPQSLETPTTSCNGTQCTLRATFSIGSDPTKAIQTKTTLATFTASVIAPTQTAVTIGFDPSSAVYSVNSADASNENVLSSTIPLSFTVGGSSNSCQPNQSSCSWDSVTNTTQYHYKVMDTTSGTVIAEGDVPSSQTTVSFPSQGGDTYSCSITPVNECGSGNIGTGTSTCTVPSVTPTPTTCSGPGTVPNLHIVCPNCSGTQ